MARKRFVTRTVKETVYTVKAVNTETEKVETLIYSVSSALEEKKRLQTLHRLALNDNAVIMKILATTEQETLYGMPEEEFIAKAVILPPRSGASEEEEEGATE